MLYVTNQQTIRSTQGPTVTLIGSLVIAPAVPTRGWEATILINGQAHVVNGPNSLGTYNAAVVLLRNNGISINHQSIWTTLNIQWLQRVGQKHRRVEVPALIEICQEFSSEQNPNKKTFGPASWGSIAWRWMNLFLARDDYSYHGFMVVLGQVVEMLNPTLNPSLGCSECFAKFGTEFSRLSNIGSMSREEARKWLVEFHNSVNTRLDKPLLTYEAVAKQYFWS